MRAAYNALIETLPVDLSPATYEACEKLRQALAALSRGEAQATEFEAETLSVEGKSSQSASISLDHFPEAGAPSREAECTFPACDCVNEEDCKFPTPPALKASELGEKLQAVIAKYEGDELHDEGAFDVECETCRILNDLRALLSAVPQSTISEGWRPIETAPKKGHPIIIAAYQYHPVSPAYWNGRCWVTIGCATEGGEEPTHWMPLPEAPAPTQDAEGGKA